ncbi:MAG: FAD:protein FMN transferase [Planctomycetes bacterium]|nr:FAD:protein FMN transferase [Planctomycetota bacterium]
MNQPQPEPCFVRSDCQSISGLKRFCHEAMATTYEIIMVEDDENYARQAAAAAFDEVDRLEGELSRFIENSDIARINNLPANEPLLLGLDAFECLELGCRIYAETNGAFDITIGSLLSCWCDEDGDPRRPSQDELNLAREHTGAHLLQLDKIEHTIQLSVSPVQVDLGGIGKGYAVDRVAELLRQWSIEIALVSGGYSSVLALEGPVGIKGWPLTLSNPDNHKQILARPCMQGRALSGSGLQKGGHIIDPRTVQPVKGRLAAWASASNAATADALSTAFMIMSPDEIRQYCQSHPDVLALIMLEDRGEDAQKEKILRFGPWKDSELP